VFCGVSVGAFLAHEHRPHSRFGKRIDFGGGQEVFYKQGATEADARALGALLREVGVSDGTGPKSVQVSRDGNRLAISFVVVDEVLDDPNVVQDFRELGQQASQRVFSGPHSAAARNRALPLSQPGREPHDASPFKSWSAIE
jgi:hypothetical protein